MTEILVPNAFIDKPQKPTDRELTAELGPTRALWDQLLAELADEYKLAAGEWSCYSRKAGWSLRLKRKERNILYLAPCRGCFRVAFVLGDQAVEAARQSKLPKRAITLIDEAKRYPEGTAIRLHVKGPKDLAMVKKLAAIKLAN